MMSRLILKKPLLFLECPLCGSSLVRGERRRRRLGSFAPASRVVVVRKTTRLEYERSKSKLDTEQQLKSRLSKLGSDYENLLQRHCKQTSNLEAILSFLKSRNVTVKLRDRESYSAGDVEWAEWVFSTGGDGTLLWASSKVLTPRKLLVGLNTDPNSSEGYLCLNASHYGSMRDCLAAIFEGEVPRYQRARIRVELDGESLPVPALNEVFIGERNPSHAAYYEFSRDGRDCCEKQKSSGLLVYTGTGSTSWAYNANKITTDGVQRVLSLAQETGDWKNGSTISDDLLARVTEEYNRRNIFDGAEMRLGFAVREPIMRGIFAATHTQGTASSVSVRSLSWNTELVIDGQFHYSLKRGGVVKCHLHPQDVLTTLRNP